MSRAPSPSRGRWATKRTRPRTFCGRRGSTGTERHPPPRRATTSSGWTGPTALTGFVEQSALAHELGHAIGLVDRGLPLESPHGDLEHPLHCANPDCVMYYLNEGVWDLRDFVLNTFNMGPAVLFDEACLMDVAAALE